MPWHMTIIATSKAAAKDRLEALHALRVARFNEHRAKVAQHRAAAEKKLKAESERKEATRLHSEAEAAYRAALREGRKVGPAPTRPIFAEPPPEPEEPGARPEDPLPEGVLTLAQQLIDSMEDGGVHITLSGSTESAQQQTVSIAIQRVDVAT